MKSRQFGSFWTRLATSWRLISNVLRSRLSHASNISLQMVPVGPSEVPVLALGVCYVVLTKDDLRAIHSAVLHALVLMREEKTIEDPVEGTA